jgi:hypothetical protein
MIIRQQFHRGRWICCANIIIMTIIRLINPPDQSKTVRKCDWTAGMIGPAHTL